MCIVLLKAPSCLFPSHFQFMEELSDSSETHEILDQKVATHYPVLDRIKFQFDSLSGANNNNNASYSFSLKLLTEQSVLTAVSAQA